MAVVIVRWPAEGARVEQLRRQGIARLLLVAEGAPPPATVDCLEDWVRLPAPDTDVRARVTALEQRARCRPPEPAVGADGVLRVAGASVMLPPVEERLARALLERTGAVVSREALSRAAWPQGNPRRNALDVRMMRLRRRLAGTGLVIRTVRARGYLLEPSDSRQGPVPDP